MYKKIQSNYETNQQDLKSAEDVQQEKLELMSNASQMYKGFKSGKVKAKGLMPKHVHQNHSYGVGTLPSDSMNKIMQYQFEKDYLDIKQSKAE